MPMLWARLGTMPLPMCGSHRPLRTAEGPGAVGTVEGLAHGEGHGPSTVIYTNNIYQ